MPPPLVGWIGDASAMTSWRDRKLSEYVSPYLASLLYILAANRFIYTLVKPDHIRLAPADYVGYACPLDPRLGTAYVDTN